MFDNRILNLILVVFVFGGIALSAEAGNVSPESESAPQAFQEQMCKTHLFSEDLKANCANSEFSKCVLDRWISFRVTDSDVPENESIFKTFETLMVIENCSRDVKTR